MESMIEKVARALCLQDGNASADEVVFCRQRGEIFSWQCYVDDAKAAIEAMREPTVEMLDAIYDSEQYYIGSISWRAAIDAALEEPND